MNFGELVQRYLRSPEYAKLEQRSKDLYSLYMGRLVMVGGELPASEKHMQNGVAAKRSPNLSAKWYSLIDKFKVDGHPVTNSVKLMLRTALKVAYGWAVLNDLVAPSANPAQYIPRFRHQPMQKHPFTKSEIQRIEEWALVAQETITKQASNIEHLEAKGGLTDEEANELQALKDAHSHLRYLVAYAYFGLFAFYSGCRPDEMFLHEKRWFLRRDGKLYYNVWDAKGKAPDEESRSVLMTANEQRILDFFNRQPSDVGQAKYTFRTSNGRAFKQSSVSTYFREVCKLAGVEPRGFYNHRRGLATAMKSAGYTIPEIAERLGNSEKVVKRYIVEDNVTKANSFRGI